MREMECHLVLDTQPYRKKILNLSPLKRVQYLETPTLKKKNKLAYHLSKIFFSVKILIFYKVKQ